MEIKKETRPAASGRTNELLSLELNP